jgi:large subunit ribosomal protein L31
LSLETAGGTIRGSVDQKYPKKTTARQSCALRCQGFEVMKEGIHPKYVETAVTCGCGNTFTTRSTRKELKVDICNMCHPFYTGKLKYVDTAGRIEKFQSKFAAGSYASLQPKRQPKRKKARIEEDES